MSIYATGSIELKSPGAFGTLVLTASDTGVVATRPVYVSGSGENNYGKIHNTTGSLSFSTRRTGVGEFTDSVIVRDGNVGIGVEPGSSYDLQVQGGQVMVGPGSTLTESTLYLGNTSTYLRRPVGSSTVRFQTDRPLTIDTGGACAIYANALTLKDATESHKLLTITNLDNPIGGAGDETKMWIHEDDADFTLRLKYTGAPAWEMSQGTEVLRLKGGDGTGAEKLSTIITGSGNLHIRNSLHATGSIYAYDSVAVTGSLYLRNNVYTNGSMYIRDDTSNNQLLYLSDTWGVDARSPLTVSGHMASSGSSAIANGDGYITTHHRAITSTIGPEYRFEARRGGGGGNSPPQTGDRLAQIRVRGFNTQKNLAGGDDAANADSSIIKWEAEDNWGVSPSTATNNPSKMTITMIDSAGSSNIAQTIKSTGATKFGNCVTAYSLALGTGDVVYPNGVFCIGSGQKLRFNDGGVVEDLSGDIRLSLTNAGPVNIHDKSGNVSLVVSGTYTAGVGISGPLQVTGGQLKNASNDIVMHWNDADQVVSFPDDIIVTGGGSPGGRLTFGNGEYIHNETNNQINIIANTTWLSGDLEVAGDDIKDSAGNTVFSFGGDGALDSPVTVRSGGHPQLRLESTSTLSSGVASLQLNRVPTDGNIAVGDQVGSLMFRGCTETGDSILTGAEIQVLPIETWNTDGILNAVGSEMLVRVSEPGGTAPTTVQTIRTHGITGSAPMKLVDAGVPIMMDDQPGSGLASSDAFKKSGFDMFLESSDHTSGITGIGFSTTGNTAGAAIVYKDRGNYSQGQLAFFAKYNTGADSAPECGLVLSGSVKRVRSDWMRDQTTSDAVNYDNVVVGVSSGELRRWTSDRRQKKDIQELNNSLDDICMLMPKLYRDIEQSNDEPFSPGLIADEVEAVIPELVTGRSLPDDKLRGVSYQAISVYIINALKEIRQRLEALESE